MLDRVERMGNQLPPRLKAILNLVITVALVLMATPLLWSGYVDRAWSDLAMGTGMLMLGVFNLFT